MLCFACGNCNIILTCFIYTHIHTYTHTDLNFAIFWKDCEIKFTSKWDNAGPRNVIHGKSGFLMKTSVLRKLLTRLREITKLFTLLNKMIEKRKVRKFIFNEVSCF